MTDLRQTPKPRDYFSRREQWRLFMLVMSLGLVLVLMNEARKPEKWRWLFPKSATGQPGEPAADQLRPLPEPTEADGVDAVEPDVSRAGGDASSGRYFAGVRPELLATVRDKTRFRSEEQEAWFHLFAVLKAADPARLRRASPGRVARLQLSEQSKAYRGELVTIRGLVRRVHWLAAPKNDDGIAGYYQTWVYPDDSPGQPVVVYCLNWPEGVATGMELSQPAEVTGFYFKRWLYQATGGPQLVPVVLARDVEPEKSRARPAGAVAPGGWQLAGVILAAAVVAVLVVSYVFRRTRRGKVGNRVIRKIAPILTNVVGLPSSLKCRTGEHDLTEDSTPADESHSEKP